jgi:hypothetical protein
MRLPFSIFLLATISACSTIKTPHKGAYSGSQQEAARVVVADGIDRSEAKRLATAYFYRFISGCGYVGTPQLHGAYWSARVFQGYGGTPAGFIYVDARTGETSKPGSPTIYQKDFSS